MKKLMKKGKSKVVCEEEGVGLHKFLQLRRVSFVSEVVDAFVL